ncbi:MAG TPA: IPT/TIG domain-containing protein [Actinomycetes bacterium]|nr:IPT/TIG domain-containing protein [Actinomycetes bacterium]
MAVGSGGGVQTKDVSSPSIASIGLSSGPVAGGTKVRVNGHAFIVEAPTVKFDGVPGTNLVVLNDAAIDVDTPAGKLTIFLTAGPYRKLLHGTVSGGPFTVGETITGATSAVTATIKEVGAGFLLVDAVSGEFTASETLNGAASSASASFTSIGDLPFQVGEVVTGASSGSTGTLATLAPLKLVAPSAAFSDGEQITGGTSGARATLATPWMSGFVDVDIENANGQRITGGCLAAAYEFTV